MTARSSPGTRQSFHLLRKQTFSIQFSSDFVRSFVRHSRRGKVPKWTLCWLKRVRVNCSLSRRSNEICINKSFCLASVQEDMAGDNSECVFFRAGKGIKIWPSKWMIYVFNFLNHWCESFVYTIMNGMTFWLRWYSGRMRKNHMFWKVVWMGCWTNV